jgi:hypothetical protein
MRKIRLGEQDEGYQILGVLIYLQLIIKFGASFFSKTEHHTEVENNSNPTSSYKCILCLERCASPTITPCG